MYAMYNSSNILIVDYPSRLGPEGKFGHDMIKKLMADIIELRKKHKTTIVYGPKHWEEIQMEELIDVLRECKLQLEYLNQKFPETGTTNSVLAKADAVLAKYPNN